MATTNKLTTSITVQFTSASGGSDANTGHVSAEIGPAVADFTNENAVAQSNLIAGQKVTILVFMSAGYTVSRSFASCGTIEVCSPSTYTQGVTETLSFIGTSRGSLSKPPAGDPTFTWFGNTPSSVKRDGQDLIITSNGTDPIADSDACHVCMVTYNSTASAYTFNSPANVRGFTSYSAALVFVVDKST